MENKLRFKKFLAVMTGIFVIIAVGWGLFDSYEYLQYTRNCNKKIIALVEVLKKEYPDLSEDEIMQVINCKDDKVSNSMLKRYGIEEDGSAIIMANDEIFKKQMLADVGIVALSVIFAMTAVLIYTARSDRKIKKITQYIHEINNRNYTLDMDSFSEDELSILTNELYKVTIMLKEDALNSKKDKEDLKTSLENISHQIKTPLTSVLIILENMLEDENMEKSVRDDFIMDIKREINNVSFFVNNILKLSKLESNTVNFHKKDIYISEIVENAINNVSIICEIKNINIVEKMCENPIINCDAKWQTEAVTNILKNAIEHSKEGSNIYVEMGFSKIYAYIDIYDTGNGIEKEDIKHIFERFYQSKNASCDSIGIGLCLAKNIVESNGGKITVESDENGTRFSIKYYMLEYSGELKRI